MRSGPRRETPRPCSYGLGPLGQAVGRTVLERASLTLVGAVDIDPEKSGREVADPVDEGVPPTGVQ